MAVSAINSDAAIQASFAGSAANTRKELRSPAFQLNQPPITPLAITQLPGTDIQVICPPQGEWQLKICVCRSHQSCLHSAHTIGYEPNLEGSAFSGYMRNDTTSFFLHFPI
jgi:hypothetical protein